MDLNKLSLGDKIILGTGILLIIDLLFLPWHNIDFGPFGSVTRRAVQSPNSLWGILALLLTIAVVAVVAVRKLTTTALPDGPQPWPKLIFFGTIAVLVLLLIKLVVETDYLGFGAWLGILLGVGLAYGGFLVSKEDDVAPASGGGTTAPF